MADETDDNKDGVRTITVRAESDAAAADRALAELDAALRRLDGMRVGAPGGGDHQPGAKGGASPFRPGDVVNGRRIAPPSMQETIDGAIQRARASTMGSRSGLRQSVVMDRGDGNANNVRAADIASWIRNPASKISRGITRALPAVAIAAAATHTIATIGGDIERGATPAEALKNIGVRGLQSIGNTVALPELFGSLGMLLGKGSPSGARAAWDSWFRNMLKTDAEARKELASIAQDKAAAVADARAVNDAQLARTTTTMLSGVELTDEDRWEIRRRINQDTFWQRELAAQNAGAAAAVAAAKAAAGEP